MHSASLFNVVVFPYKKSVSQDFNSGTHPYGFLPDNIQMHWNFLSRDAVLKTIDLLQSNSLSSSGIDFIIFIACVGI